MSNFFPSSQGPPAHAQSPSMQYAPDRTQLSPPSQDGIRSQGLGNTSKIPQYPTQQGLTLPPLQHGGGNGAFLSSPQHGFAPQPPQPMPQQNNKSHSQPPVLSSPRDYNNINEDFHSYDPVQQPEARNNRSPPKAQGATESPDGKAPSSNGRRRARTKVVAWDPKDLEDIYERKEIKKEDWDSICRDYPSRTRVAMRQQVIKLREKKQREASGQSHQTASRSTYTDSPQPANPSNEIRWATVNGSSPANIDAFHRRESLDDEELSEEEYLSSAPDSDHDGKLNRHFDQPVRSTPQQTQAHPPMELPPNQFGVPPMPVIIQEAPQASTQAPLNFDVMAAQSRGKPIAPRQPPAPPSMPIEIMDDRHQHPQPPPQPDIRANQRGKRGRETEDFETSESRSSSNFSKRRKHPMEPAGAPMVMSNVGEGHVAPFNPAVGYPMAPAPPRIPQDSDLDELCIRFRETYRILKAGFEENERMQSEIYEAALGRANARVVQAQQSADDLSVSFSEDMKELVRLRDQRMATQLEFEHRDQQYDALQEENQRLRDEHARTLGECTQLRGEIARKDERIAALSEALEHERREPLSRPDMNTPTVPQPSPMDVVQQEIHAAKQNAERADAANDLLAEEIRRLRSDHAADRRKFEEVEAENRRKFYEVKAEHENLSAALEDFVSKDLEELTQKMIKKHVLGLKEADQQVANKIKEANRSFNKPDQLASGDANKPSGPTSNGRIPQEQS